MICERCGSYMPDDALTCEHCGSLLHDGRRPRETGVRAIRQGRQSAAPPVIPDASRQKIPEYGDYELSSLPVESERGVRRKTPTLESFASRPNTRRGVPVNTGVGVKPLSSKRVKTHPVKLHGVNWMLVGLVAVVLLIGAAVGVYFYMQTTDEGQRTIARRNTLSATDAMIELAKSEDLTLQADRETVLKDLGAASAQAYWLVGQAFLDAGDMTDAIMALRIADVLDPDNYDGLLSLASAYELDGDDDNAESIYLDLLQNVSPSRTDAYIALIRLYQDNERGPEAADMMLLAYTNTDKESFRLQRKDYIPNTPEVDLAAGRYELEQTVNVTSPQGYDIYYTTDSTAELPEGGTLLSGSAVTIPEGTISLRAVCVSGDLVSDVMSVSYVVYYPSPSAPQCNLAPNTYSRRRNVSLRAGGTDKTEDLTFYYTIDGSIPDAEGGSPIYDGTPIELPSGRVTLRAVAVNGYGKVSSTLEVGYKFNVKPDPLKVYGEEDTFSDFTLNKTTLDEFTAAYGSPESDTATTYLNSDKQARALVYGWGEADFLLVSGQWQLVRVEMNKQLCAGPRGVGFGSGEREITAVFKDMGQKQSPNGDRGLYYADPTIGHVYAMEDGTRMVQYVCQTVAGNEWVLQYCLAKDRVTKIVHYYQP